MHAGPQLEPLSLQQPRIQQDLRTGLCVRFADEALAMATILARCEFHPIGIGIGFWRISRRKLERMPAELAGRLIEGDTRFQHRKRRLWKFVLARRLEGIAALLNLAAEVARLAGN